MVLNQNCEMEIPSSLLPEFDNGGFVGIHFPEDPKVNIGEMVIWNHNRRFGIAKVAGITPQDMCYCVILKKMN